MMTSQNPAQGYESGILQQLVKNSEDIAVIKLKVEKIDTIEVRLNSLDSHLDSLQNRLESIEVIGQKIVKGIGVTKWLLITVGIGIVINILSIPITNYLN
jgi:tetrahydromethanopterin S-methyltransferase subunit G